ncbi:hypothetical protein J0895_04985 [Phormidium pseudopriestleyi FRX01]|uniref:Uncharacterized protein n=1 Tax=Phormidium pseudopriestleyi FRX01 TaxID=1759528 RepID=A0ABS3FMY1_9CYAN|nr:hypothetical protein [Phormidium pseudopriestleyi]MBO0348469.1 hypothetical protein [Phormidium pseudopriestleyi FRX01]
MQGTNRVQIGTSVSLASAIAADLASPSAYSNALGTASVEFNRSGTFQLDPFLAAQVEPFSLLFALNRHDFPDAPLQF